MRDTRFTQISRELVMLFSEHPSGIQQFMALVTALKQIQSKLQASSPDFSDDSSLKKRSSIPHTVRWSSMVCTDRTDQFITKSPSSQGTSHHQCRTNPSQNIHTASSINCGSLREFLRSQKATQEFRTSESQSRILVRAVFRLSRNSPHYLKALHGILRKLNGKALLRLIIG